MPFVDERIPIARIAGLYLVFDIEAVTYLRREHNICGVLVGGIPQVPQQNVFLGLPVELLPEEARLLVEKHVAYIVDDKPWHQHHFSCLQGHEKAKYLVSLRDASRKAQISLEKTVQKRAERALAIQAADASLPGQLQESVRLSTLAPHGQHAGSASGSSIASLPKPVSVPALTVTPTTTYDRSSVREVSSRLIMPTVPLSYPLYAHLHGRGYFMTPGLRFGCDYTVYPGDPLRFHSHFLAVGYSWFQKVPLLDFIGGGRLGTGVKKGFLIGAEQPDSEPSASGHVRTFSIEWGGM